jgi:hypothetical protein
MNPSTHEGDDVSLAGRTNVLTNSVPICLIMRPTVSNFLAMVLKYVYQAHDWVYNPGESASDEEVDKAAGAQAFKDV